MILAFYFLLMALLACHPPGPTGRATTNHGSMEKAEAQALWTEISETAFARRDGKKEWVSRYRTLRLDTATLDSILDRADSTERALREAGATILLPFPDGSFQRFRFSVSATAAAGSEGQKSIRTFMGRGADDPYLGAAFDFTPQGFHAMITQENKVIYIEPYTRGDRIHYICYYKHDIQPGKRRPFEEGGPIRDQ